MTDLITRLEAATGPNRELDAVIWRFKLKDTTGDHWFSDGHGNVTKDDHAPRYTASIDAALTLVPDGWSYVIRPGYVQLLHPRSIARDEEGKSKTIPLALCIAALRAQEKDTNA